MRTEDIIPRVRVIVNEAMGSCTDSFAAETDRALDYFIEAGMKQLASMPGFEGECAVLNEVDDIQYATRPDGLVYATIKASKDTLRLVSVWLEGWPYPVYNFLPAAGSEFLAQYSSVPGIGNSENSPKVFLSSIDENTIIAHSVKKEGKYEVKYIPVPQPKEDGDIPFPLKYLEALSYTAAGLYLQSINEYDGAKAAFDTSASIIETLK